MINLSQNVFFFFPLAGFIIAMALGVLFTKKVIRALCFLALGMVGVGVLFLAQNAVFLGGLQLIFYTGTIVSLFLVTFMVVDVNKVTNEFFKEKLPMGNFVQVGLIGIILGLSLGVFSLKTYVNIYKRDLNTIDSIKNFISTLFQNHIFLFEIIGVLILVTSVAAIVVSKTRKY